MNDEQPPDEPASHADDERDEHVASLLDVPPLDDVTRRRLVTRAVADAGGRRVRAGRALFAAAAALVVLLLVGGGAFVLATRDNDNGGTAARSPVSGSQPAPRAPQAGEADASAAGIPDLGDLGDLTDDGNLRRQITLAQRDPAPVPRTTTPACLERAVTGNPAPDAFATGTHRGRPVLVLVLPGSSNSTTAVMLDQETCQAISVVNLA
jgi:hypothetical protein